MKIHVLSNQFKKKNTIDSCKFEQHAIFWANIFVRTVLTDLLHTSCQQLYPIVNIAISNNFEHWHVYTTRFSQ